LLRTSDTPSKEADKAVAASRPLMRIAYKLAGVATP
jgi:hypothetical protein